MKLYLKYDWNDDTKAFAVAKGESQHKLELSKDSRKVIREIVDDIAEKSGIKSKYNLIFCLVFWILLLVFYIIFAVILSVKPSALSVSVFSPDIAANSTNSTTSTASATSASNTTVLQQGYYSYSRVDVSSFGANNGFGIFLVAVVPFILFSLLAFTFVRKTRQQLVRDHVARHEPEYQKRLATYNMALGYFFFEIEDDEESAEEEQPRSKKGAKTEVKKKRGCMAGKLMVGALEFFDKGSDKDRALKAKKEQSKKAEKEDSSKSQTGQTQDQSGKPNKINIDQVAVEVVGKAAGTTFSNWEKSHFLPDEMPILPSTMRGPASDRLPLRTTAPSPVDAPALPVYRYQEFSDYPAESARSQYPLLTGAAQLNPPAYSSSTRLNGISQSTATSIRRRL